MFRRRFGFGRPLLRRPILGAMVLGGLGYAIGRRGSGQQPGPGAAPVAPLSESADATARLQNLDRLRAAGTITDAEYQAQRAELVGRL
jgi:Short C-terminal domain